MLSTIDNEYDPFTEFDKWYVRDFQLGHNCCGLLGSRAFTSDSLSDNDNKRAIEQAIDEIVADPEIAALAQTTYIKVLPKDKEEND